MLAVETATRGNVPWVLDPVFIDRSAPRAAFARALIASAPNAVRLNGAEFSALADSEPSREALAAYARDKKTVLGLSGETDLVSDGERLAAIANGHPLMAKVTAMGCAASALVAACLAVEPDAWRATAGALVMIGVAGELAATQAAGPGSFAVAIIDAFHNLDGPTAHRTRTGELMDVDLRLYALIDPAVAGGRSLTDLAGRVAGSATLVQLRDKHGFHPRHGGGSARFARRAGAGAACRC